jgi:uncharacterized protein involved in exopolysaccharide biosynthesis
MVMSDMGTSGAEIDLVRLGAALRAYALRLVLGSLVIAVATYGFLATLAPRFASEAQLSVVAKLNPLPERSDRSPDTLGPRLDKEAINTHVRALMSPDLLRQVAGEFKLAERPEFNSARGSIDLPMALLQRVGLSFSPAAETDDDRVLSVILRQLEVMAVRDSRFISIKFTSADATLAAAFANRLAEAYQQLLISAPVQETSDVLKAMQPKIAQLQHEVVEADADVEAFRAKTDQYRGGLQSLPINDQKLATLNDELIRTESARGEAEARWQTARDMLVSGTGDIVPDVQKSPLIQNLIQSRVALERQIFEAQATLLPAHPRMRQLKADLEGLKQQVDAEMRKVVQGLEKDWRFLAGKADNISAQIELQKQKLSGGAGNEARLRALEAGAQAKRAELERLQKQLEDNRSTVNMNRVPSEVVIVSRARPSGVQVYPRKGPYTGLAFAGTLIVGLALVLTGQLLKAPAGNAPLTPPQGGKRGRKPKEAGRDWPVMPALVPGRSEAMPAMAAAMRRIIAVKSEFGGRRTLVVGHQPGLDVAAEALQLARASVAKGETVLVACWDPQGVMALPPLGGTPGLSDVVVGDCLFDEVLRPLDGGYYVLSAGRPFRDEKALYDRDRLNLTFDVLDDTFDHVIMTGERSVVGDLFTCLEGRFDAVLEIVPVGDEVREQPNQVFGFTVQGMEIVRILRPAQATHFVTELRAAS